MGKVKLRLGRLLPLVGNLYDVRGHGCARRYGVRSEDTTPASLAERIRNLAAKREQQAAATAGSNEIQIEALRAAARSYLALADIVAKSPQITLPDSDQPPAATDPLPKPDTDTTRRTT